MEDLKKGQQVGNFVVDSILGYGGYSKVYSGTLNGRSCALKIIHSSILNDSTDVGNSEVRYFTTGREISKELGDSVNFPLFLDSGDQPRPYFVMEFVPGVDLDKILISDPKLYFAEAIRVGHRCTEAYELMHTKGFVHCDVKPENLVYERPKSLRVIDFDTSFKGRLVHLNGTDVLLPQEPMVHIIGTSPYFSPEALNCNPNSYSDVWGVGSIIYETLTGRTPFSGKNLLDLAKKIFNKEPSRLKIDPLLEEMIMQCFRKDWRLRPDMKTLKEGLFGYMKQKGIIPLS